MAFDGFWWLFGGFWWLLAFGFWWRGQVQLCCLHWPVCLGLCCCKLTSLECLSISLYVSLSYMHYLASSFLLASPNASYQSIHQSFNQSIWINLSMCLFVYLSVCLSVCLSVIHAMFSFLPFPSLPKKTPWGGGAAPWGEVLRPPPQPPSGFYSSSYHRIYLWSLWSNYLPVPSIITCLLLLTSLCLSLYMFFCRACVILASSFLPASPNAMGGLPPTRLQLFWHHQIKKNISLLSPITFLWISWLSLITFLLKSLAIVFYFSVEISTFSVVFYWDLPFFTFLLEFQLFLLLLYWNLYFCFSVVYLLFTFLLVSLFLFFYSIEISIFFLYFSTEIFTFSWLFCWNLYFPCTFLLKFLLLFYWNLYFLFTFLLRSLLSRYFSIGIPTFLFAFILKSLLLLFHW